MKVVHLELEPYTLKECFDILNRSVNNDSKMILLDESLSEYEYHCDIGLFIRNEILHVNEVLQKNITEKFQATGNPKPGVDDLSEYIYLKWHRKVLK